MLWLDIDFTHSKEIPEEIYCSLRRASMSSQRVARRPRSCCRRRRIRLPASKLLLLALIGSPTGSCSDRPSWGEA